MQMETKNLQEWEKVRRRREGVNEERDRGTKISTERGSLGIEIGIAYPLSFPLPPRPTLQPPLNIHTIPLPSLFLRICFFLFPLLFISFFLY